VTSLKLVIDTKRLISAALCTQGAPEKLLLCVLTHRSLAFSQAIFAELFTRIGQSKCERYISLDDCERLFCEFNA
jgi:predicted nucleic acid-binding protein